MTDKQRIVVDALQKVADDIKANATPEQRLLADTVREGLVARLKAKLL